MKYPGNLVLASASPRRKQLLGDAGFAFEVIVKDIDETFPEELKGADVARFIAMKKASAYDDEVNQGKTIITADTIVCLEDKILGKPANRSEAVSMLELLSGKAHEVITAVCIRQGEHSDCFHVCTTVSFRELSSEEISHYIELCKPFDKAGAYGIQEWIGLVAITSISGSYNNVVGLPVAELYARLMQIKAGPKA